MPTPTYTPLANITLGSSAASVTFSSISQVYRDVICVFQATGTAGSYVKCILNNDTTATNYNYVKAIGYATTQSSSTGNTNSNVMYNDTGLDNNTIQILDYSATDKHKTALVRGEYGTIDELWMASMRWANTAAVTTFKLEKASGSFAIGSTFALYGVTA